MYKTYIFQHTNSIQSCLQLLHVVFKTINIEYPFANKYYLNEETFSSHEQLKNHNISLVKLITGFTLYILTKYLCVVDANILLN